MSDLIIIVVSIILSFIIVGSIAKNLQDNPLEKQAIQHKCAQYNVVTGDFEWIK